MTQGLDFLLGCSHFIKPEDKHGQGINDVFPVSISNMYFKGKSHQICCVCTQKAFENNIFIILNPTYGFYTKQPSLLCHKKYS